MAIALEIFTKLIDFDRDNFNCTTLQDCYVLCKHIALSHYENFPVGSFLVGKQRQHHFFAVYAFARLGDDIADEHTIPQDKRLALLEQMHHGLEDISTQHPIFRAVQNSILQCNLPTDSFHRLLQAFEQDSAFSQPTTWEDVYAYCHLSANPVGEVVLSLFNVVTPITIHYSNSICTALQLTNFWQDFKRDIPNKRFYVPLDVMKESGLPRNSFDTTEFWHKFPTQSELMLDRVLHQTQVEFDKGKKLLVQRLPFRLRVELSLTIAGGERILNKSRRLGCTIFEHRPALSGLDVPRVFSTTLGLLLKSLIHKFKSPTQ